MQHSSGIPFLVQIDVLSVMSQQNEVMQVEINFLKAAAVTTAAEKRQQQ